MVYKAFPVLKFLFNYMSQGPHGQAFFQILLYRLKLIGSDKNFQKPSDYFCNFSLPMLVEKILFITTDNPYLADLAILPFPLTGRENCYLGKMPILTKSPNRFIKRIYRFSKPNADLVFVY